MLESIMTNWQVPHLVHSTLGEISRYTSYLFNLGDVHTSFRCFQLLQSVNKHIQTIYYSSVLQHPLQAAIQKERIVAAYVTTATCVVLWAMAMKDHVRSLLHNQDR